MPEGGLMIAEDDPILTSDVLIELERQVRALDAYGSYDAWSMAKVLDPYILTKERKREIPLVGDPDDITISRLKAFYNAIAALIEKECGRMAIPLISLTHEGFGRALITVGKLVVMEKTLRDVHRFGFPSVSKLKDEADKLLAVALEIIGAHPKAAGM